VAKNASELRFQNQLGSELLLLHAETDSLQQAENNHLMQVGKVHRHEVGRFYHMVVGKPVDVNQATVGNERGAPGSGAGGGRREEKPVDDPPIQVSPEPSFIGSGAGGAGDGDQQPPPPSLSQIHDDQYPYEYGAWVEIYGDNTTETLPGKGERGNNNTLVHGDNSTSIDGDDNYNLKGTARSNISKDSYATVGGDNHTTINGKDHYYAIEATAWTLADEEHYVTGASLEVFVAHIEAAVMHIEANIMKMQAGPAFHKGPIQFWSLG
jgi:hypothetical protein